MAKKKKASVLIDKINQRYKTNFTNMDKAMEQITQDFLDDDEMVNLAKNNKPEAFRKIYNEEFQRKTFKRYQHFMTSMFIYDK